MDDAERGFRRYERTNEDWAWRFRVLKAQILLWRGLSKEALALLAAEPPSRMSEDELVVERNLTQGLAHSFLQRFDSAQEHLSRAQQLATIKHPKLLPEVILGKGTVAVLRSDYPTAESCFRAALKLARQTKQGFVEANALGSLGVVAMRRERYGEAIDWYSAALAHARSLENQTLVAKTLGNLGWSYYRLGDLERALSLFKEAELSSGKLGLIKDQQIWLTNIGIVYSNLEDYPDAERYYIRALGIARNLENKTLVAICLDNLARLSVETRVFDRAEQYNREALELKRANHDRSSELYSLFNEASIAKGTGSFDDAVRYFNAVSRGSGENVSLRWEAEAGLADLYVAKAQVKQADLQFRKTISTIDEARKALNKEEYRLSFLTAAGKFYNDYIDFLVSRRRAREALAVAEHSRARTLAEGLGLNNKINSRHLYPASDAQAQAVARQDNAVILYYWLKPERSYLWAITPQKLALFSLPGQNEIDAAVQAWRKTLVGPRDPLEAGNPAGQKLYEMLVAPAQKLIRTGSRVVIVADSSLHGLNFETLLAPGPRPHYWIEDVEISNANSLELLAASQRKRQASGRGLLLIGDPLAAGTEFPPLARAEDEVQRVEDHFDGKQRVAFTRDQATATAYRDGQPGRFAYIHFVAHGTSSRISPLDSAVVLSKEGDAYKLYARDIVQQPLHANLVTISACYGAGERAYTGEGLVGLSWAFLRAGAHNVIGALWEVNDISTPQLMDTMYTDLQKGRDPAAALRAAKLAMLHSDSVFRRPFYWAPFQIYVGS